MEKKNVQCVEKGCTLRDDARNCTSRNCSKCGWNSSVKEAREELIREEGLTLCEDGLRRLVLPVDDTREVTT